MTFPLYALVLLTAVPSPAWSRKMVARTSAPSAATSAAESSATWPFFAPLVNMILGMSVPRPVAAARLLGGSDLAEVASADLGKQPASRIQGDLLAALVGDGPGRASGRGCSAEARCPACTHLSGYDRRCRASGQGHVGDEDVLVDRHQIAPIPGPREPQIAEYTSSPSLAVM